MGCHDRDSKGNQLKSNSRRNDLMLLCVKLGAHTEKWKSYVALGVRAWILGSTKLPSTWKTVIFLAH